MRNGFSARTVLWPPLGRASITAGLGRRRRIGTRMMRTKGTGGSSKSTAACGGSLALAVVGNGAAVGPEDGGDHALVEPVRVGYRAGDREHPERGVRVRHVARASEAVRGCGPRDRLGNACTCAACCECYGRHEYGCASSHLVPPFSVATRYNSHLWSSRAARDSQAARRLHLWTVLVAASKQTIRDGAGVAGVTW
jgi:hypothetical protein